MVIITASFAGIGAAGLSLLMVRIDVVQGLGARRVSVLTESSRSTPTAQALRLHNQTFNHMSDPVYFSRPGGRSGSHHGGEGIRPEKVSDKSVEQGHFSASSSKWPLSHSS